MKDERAPLQLFDLIARDWRTDSLVQQVCFNAGDSAVAFACADGAIRLAPTADKASPDSRIRRAVDTGRLTIAPRDKAPPPLKASDFTDGRSTKVVPHGATNFAFGKATGRINTLTPGGIASHLPVRAPGPVDALAFSPDGQMLAFACGGRLHVTPAASDNARVVTADAGITDLAFSPDGRTLAAVHATGLSRWALADLNGAPIRSELAGTPASVAWRRDGAWLVIRMERDGIALVNAATGTVTPHPGFPSAVRHADFGLSTDTVVASGAFRVAGWTLAAPGDVVTGRPGLVLVDAVAACPTRSLVAVGYANGLISIAEIGKPSEILLREDTGAGVTAMAWSANGAYLALAGSDGSAAVVEFPDSMFKS